eukprot:3805990-Pyramimonas_sp.AAC.1
MLTESSALSLRGGGEGPAGLGLGDESPCELPLLADLPVELYNQAESTREARTQEKQLARHNSGGWYSNPGLSYKLEPRERTPIHHRL